MDERGESILDEAGQPLTTIDIKAFCKDSLAASVPPEVQQYVQRHLDGNSTSCVRAWIAAGKADEYGRHLYASAGTYTLSRHVVIFDGLHLKCESPETTVFQKERENPRGKFLSHDYGVAERPPLNDIWVENCGFDMNGDPKNFASFFNLENINRMTFRENRIFDSTGVECADRDCQRQYLVVLNSHDILIENNHFSHGGRIKAGRPGKRIVIRHNHLDFVNDNGITVVDQNGVYPNVTEDILIYGNTINGPTVTGIFFGADGEHNRPGVTTRRITVFGNDISGRMGGACIRGTLPEEASEIFVGDNRCNPIGRREGDDFLSGIQIKGYRPPSTDVSVFYNYVEGETPGSLDRGAFAIALAEVCLVGNTVRNNGVALFALDTGTVVSHYGNDWGDGTIQTRDHRLARIEAIEADEVAECFVPDFLVSTDR